ncbi:hypothetical protein LCGC14_0552510 [marine sediment metagenome]|uniref:Uncharacterized protein n=1 Tax=marine sediment metagenome TaxID=412755 RepID=A0A0F9UXV2_9ZZZZ
MAITFRSVLAIGKGAAPLIGGAIRLIWKKSPTAKKAATAIENTLNRNPKKTTAGVVSAVTAAVLSILAAFWPEHAATVLQWIKTIYEASEAAS